MIAPWPRGVAGMLGAVLCAAACTRFDVQPASDADLAAAVASVDVPAGAAVLAGAGDVAMCGRLDPAEATARLLDAIVAAHPDVLIFTTGDHAYPDGTAREFAECYEPTWGRFNARTRPTPGNHDYETVGAGPYFEYFDLFDRLPAARGRGYYAFDHGAWRIVALNSLEPIEGDQLAWLRTTLEAEPRDCLLAYWHNPLFSSGFHGWQPWDRGRDTAAFWEVLQQHGVDVILNGHDHVYERFVPQNADGEPESTGVRQFIVGTGGAGLHPFIGSRRNSAYRNGDVFGVLLLALADGGYGWAFVGVDGLVHDRSETPVPCRGPEPDGR